MKTIKSILAITLITATSFAYAGSSSSGRSDEGSQSNACMIPIHTNDYFQFLNANIIRYVRIRTEDNKTIKILYAANTSDNTISIEYKTKEEALAAANNFVRAINNCGKKQ